MNIQQSATEFFGGACYAYCIAWLYGGEDKSIQALTLRVCNAWKNGYIEDDGYVIKPVAFANSIQTDRPFVQVAKGEIPITGIYITEYVWKNGSHFVVYDFDKKEVVFDPYGNSKTVKYGVQKSIRIYRR